MSYLATVYDDRNQVVAEHTSQSQVEVAGAAGRTMGDLLARGREGSVTFTIDASEPYVFDLEILVEEHQVSPGSDDSSAYEVMAELCRDSERVEVLSAEGDVDARWRGYARVAVNAATAEQAARIVREAFPGNSLCHIDIHRSRP